ncbi:MAG TPA: class I SAM-dependent methyltransferase [Solirubrobacterales bacterium]|nr:class I SAM-dependent methyltransferase [Solirubrobacterales bacterium]
MVTDQAASERKRGALALFAGLDRRYDMLSAVLSLGQDPRWRRRMVAAVEARPDDRVLDVATGTGMVARALVERYRCSVVGIDQSRDMLAGARRALAARPDLAARIELLQGEAEWLPFADSEFDHLTFTYLLRYVDDPGATLTELARVVKPGGRIAALDFGLPDPPLWRPLWRLYTRLVLPAAGRAFGSEWFEVGRFLGPNIEELYSRWPLERQVELWRAAGIGAVKVRRMSVGGGVVFSGVRDG